MNFYIRLVEHYLRTYGSLYCFSVEGYFMPLSSKDRRVFFGNFMAVSMFGCCGRAYNNIITTLKKLIVCNFSNLDEKCYLLVIYAGFHCYLRFLHPSRCFLVEILGIDAFLCSMCNFSSHAGIYNSEQFQQIR